MVNKYIDKVCPFCKTRFVAEDEIVICSACEMPHHKDCWIENQGCTTFGCVGTIQNINNAQPSTSANEISYIDVATSDSTKIYCSQCGTPSNSDSTFCGKCGSRLKINTKIYCSQCGTPSDSDSAFCGKCGFRLKNI